MCCKYKYVCVKIMRKFKNRLMKNFVGWCMKNWDGLIMRDGGIWWGGWLNVKNG